MAGIAVALSGGGHRASLFGLGVLLYLADAGKNREVTSISSVSGGSLTNGYVAQAASLKGKSYPEMSAEEFRAVAADLARQIALRGTLWATPLTWAYVAGLVVLALGVLVGTWFLPWPLWARGLTFVAGLLVLAWFGSLRGAVCARSFARTVFSPRDGRRKTPTRLDEIDSGIDHVICATDLHSGEHVYFSGRFVCSYRYGWGVPADLPLHAAVQASAALPGGFPPRWLRTGRHRFQAGAEPGAAGAPMVLADGGVYDNMGDQWARGVERRNERWKALDPGLHEPDELIVVNASAPMDWRSTWALGLPVVGEFLSLKRDQSILYDNGTSVRRRAMHDEFLRARTSGDGMRGAIVQIDRSPFDLPEDFRGPSDRLGDRARAVLELLGAANRPEWDAAREASMGVKTTLSRMGPETSAGLLRHGYALAMANLHLLLDYPPLKVPSQEWFLDLMRSGEVTPR